MENIQHIEIIFHTFGDRIHYIIFASFVHIALNSSVRHTHTHRITVQLSLSIIHNDAVQYVRLNAPFFSSNLINNFKWRRVFARLFIRLQIEHGKPFNSGFIMRRFLFCNLSFSLSIQWPELFYDRCAFVYFYCPIE